MSSIWCENLREVKNYGARYRKFQENDTENQLPHRCFTWRVYALFLARLDMLYRPFSSHISCHLI